MLPKMPEKDRKRLKRKVHIRKKISGTAERPRMTVKKSCRRISIQIIDDTKGSYARKRVNLGKRSARD